MKTIYYPFAVYFHICVIKLQHINLFECTQQVHSTVNPQTCWALRQLVIKWLALSHTVWIESDILFHTWLFLHFQMIHNITLNNSRWFLSSICRIENKFSLMLLLTFRHALICIYKPACCQHWVLLGHRNNTWSLSSFPSLHILQCTGHCTPRLLSLKCVGNTFRTTYISSIEGSHFWWDFCSPYQVSACCNTVSVLYTCCV
jgi:hypothetical protein